MKYPFRFFATTVLLIAPFIAHADTATILVRDGATAISSVVAIPDAGATDVQITPTSGATTSAIFVPAQNALALLYSLDAATSTFDITGIKYFDPFSPGDPYASGLLLDCVSIPSFAAAPQCGAWQYAVSGSNPSVGAGVFPIHAGDTLIWYFGYPRQVALSASFAAAGTAVTAAAQTYNPADNTFAPATGVTIGATQQNPADPFNPLEIATSTVDSNGQAVFTLTATGTYNFGIKEDFYFPTTPLSVTEPPAQQTVTQTPVGNGPPVASGSGGGGGISTSPGKGGGVSQFNVPSALAYLTSKQHVDGSFDSPLLTDWAALAFAAQDPGIAKTNLKNYLLTASPGFASATDYERHAMALEALGIDPSQGTARNYIGDIISRFDGTQVGDPSLVNDDIFALFPLTHAGYGASDPIITSIINFILTKQFPNGSWEGSADLTASAIQALAPFPSYVGVPQALQNARAYLRAQQQADGGFSADGEENSFSTSWALQAIKALNDSALNWTPGGYSPNDYLASLQQADGGVEPASKDPQTRQWATEYAIPGALGKTWDSILRSFPKPGAARATAAASTTSTTDTATNATTTLPAIPSPATSTPPTTGTTTVAIATSSTGNTASQGSPKQHPQIRSLTAYLRIQEPPTKIKPAAASADQTVAAASVGSGFLGTIWNAIVLFFAHLF